MKIENSDYIKLERLDKSIDEIRDVLNEISFTVEDNEYIKERLLVSQCLDELIVEYMKQIKKISA
jgi:hypothetical protein